MKDIFQMADVIARREELRPDVQEFFSECSADELLGIASDLRTVAHVLEATAMDSVDYDEIGDPREKL